jgi:hypothetical protein
MTEQQPPHEIDILKLTFLFIGLGLTAYIGFRLTSSIVKEISTQI